MDVYSVPDTIYLDLVDSPEPGLQEGRRVLLVHATHPFSIRLNSTLTFEEYWRTTLEWSLAQALVTLYSIEWSIMGLLVGGYISMHTWQIDSWQVD